MIEESRHIPASSQTVGPFFRIGLEYLVELAPKLGVDAPQQIEIRGRVLDGDGAPVPDAMLEFWSAGTAAIATDQNADGLPAGFRRVATAADGSFSAAVVRPTAVPLGDGRMQAPHMLVLVFARGLLRNLISRVYLGDELANASDAVLSAVPAERRGTMIARCEAGKKNSYEWNVILQGRDETVFFAW
jgi:protocatechuate 3,4-dioxygenase alpha subunit